MQTRLEKRKNDILMRFLKRREATLLAIILIIGAFLSFATDTFLQSDNLFNVARQFSLIVIVAIGQTLVLVSGGIDLSVGSIMGFSGIITSLAAISGLGTFASILIGIISGGLFGLFNGLLIARVKINPFIITLGTLSIARGIVLVITKGYSIRVTDKVLLFLGQGYIGLVPVPVILMLIIVAFMTIVLSSTVFGSNVRAIGGNEEAAIISGINVGSDKTWVYLISGVLSSIAGIVLAGRLNVGQPSAGTGSELESVAAAIVGGTTLSGGEGSILGTLVGAILLGILSNAMVLMNISMFFQQIVTGAIIIGVVTLDVVARKK